MRDGSSGRLRQAWLLLCLAIAVHVADEAANGFLSVYNPTIEAIRQSAPWLPLPVFRFDVWIIGLTAGVLLLLALSSTLLRGARWMRRAAAVLAVVMIGNAVGHVAATVFGRTVESVRFEGPMPGFWSSPLLVAAALLLLVRLHASRPDVR